MLTLNITDQLFFHEEGNEKISPIRNGETLFDIAYVSASSSLLSSDRFLVTKAHVRIQNIDNDRIGVSFANCMYFMFLVRGINE